MDTVKKARVCLQSLKVQSLSNNLYWNQRPVLAIHKKSRQSRMLYRMGLYGLSFMFLISVVSGVAAAPTKQSLISSSLGADGLPEGWKPLTFGKIERHTDYQLTQEGLRPVITATSEASASGLIRTLDIDSKEIQHISWCWKINRTIEKGDARTKKGDDYAARIYVTFKFDPDEASFFERAKFKTYKLFYGEYPPKGALNYVWANQLKKGEAVSNAFTDRAQMIAVKSGAKGVGEWSCEERNLYEDYKRYFGGEPPRIIGVAVMTDTDNTGESAIASYADLMLW